jgi:hypothetical protein
MSAPTRDVQSSLWPDLRADKPVGPLLGSVFVGSNADLIAAVAPLYLTGSVLDVTYGDGRWWDRYRPDPFTYHDKHKVDGIDFRRLPEPDRSVDAVCFDPPYVPAGGGPSNETCDKFRDRFGLDWGDGYRSYAELSDLIRLGLAECARVSRRWVLVKCMEFVSSARFCDMPHQVTNWALDLDLAKYDQIVHHTGNGPGAHNIFTPLRARRHHSYLLVFEVA